MSSTTGIQNVLVNLIRPVYAYDATATLYTPKIEIVNVDTYSGNVVSVLRADISDANSNVYVGDDAGNTPATLTRNCFYNVALGVSAGNSMSNVSNAVYLGYNAGAGATSASNVIGIGSGAGGNGSNNIFLGTNTKSTGSSNILIGHGINLGSQSNRLQVGSLVYGSFASNWVGINTPSPINNFSNVFDVSGNAHIYGNLGINTDPGDRTLDLNGNFRASDAYGTLDFSNGVTSSSGGFASVRGTTAVTVSPTTIGALKKGIVLISAVDTANSSKHAARHVLAYTTSNANDIGSNVSGGSASITFSGSNIQITDAANGTYDWSITYLPLP